MSGQSTHPFTCNTCQVAFRSSDLQRTHMQSDWHRYNLKRRVASLPPLSSEIFAEKVLANKATAAATAARASFERGCEICAKTYFSENAYINHLSSQKHKVNVAKAGRSDKGREEDVGSVMSSTFSLGEPIEKVSKESLDEDAEEEFQEVIDGIKDTSIEDGSEPVSRRPTRPHHSAAGEGIPQHPLSPTDTNASTATSTTNGYTSKRDSLLECLFCTNIFSDLDTSLDHMQKTHGMFIPERNYLVDLNGLVKYLNQKVNDEYECLYCGRLKWSEDGIKTHMRDTNHCKIAYETEDQQLEIGQFYDFRGTYSDSEWDSDEEVGDAAPGGGVKLGAKRATTTTVENGDDENLPDDNGEEGGWETDSTASSCPTEELGRVYVDAQSNEEAKDRLKSNRHHSHADTRPHKSVDGFHSHAHTTPHAVYHDEFELHLPSGRTAGHRSLNKYYRQNLHSHPTPQEREQRLLTAGSGDDSEEEPRYRGRDRGRQVMTRANGGQGMMAVTDAKKREVRAVEKREQKREQRVQAQKQWRINTKGNSQKHFRDPLLQ